MSDQTLTPQQQMLQQLRIGCHGYIDGLNTSYGYVPSLAAGIVFLVLFGLSMIAHTVQCVWKRTWWTMVFTVGCMSTLTFSFCLPKINTNEHSGGHRLGRPHMVKPMPLQLGRFPNANFNPDYR